MGDGATLADDLGASVALAVVGRAEGHPARPGCPQPAEHRVAGDEVVAGVDEHLEVEMRPEAEAAAAGKADGLPGHHVLVEGDRDAAIGPAGEVVVQRVPPVAVPDTHEVTERTVLLGAVASLGVGHHSVLGRRHRPPQRHRIVDPGVVVIHATRVRLGIPPRPARVVELDSDPRVAIDPIVQRDPRVVEREGVVIRGTDGSGADGQARP
jgi:hypothetical protein